MKKRGGATPNANFRGEKRTNDINCSTTDPDARLRRAPWSMALEGVASSIATGRLRQPIDIGHAWEATPSNAQAAS
jgi:hypothetical protein